MTGRDRHRDLIFVVVEENARYLKLAVTGTRPHDVGDREVELEDSASWLEE